jgi:hypothetical protein
MDDEISEYRNQISALQKETQYMLWVALIGGMGFAYFKSGQLTLGENTILGLVVFGIWFLFGEIRNTRIEAISDRLSRASRQT